MPGERGRIGPQGAPVSRIFLLSPCNSSLVLLKFKSLSLKVFIHVTASHFRGEFCCSLRKLGLSSFVGWDLYYKFQKSRTVLKGGC